jgi:hypothetical protein
VTRYVTASRLRIRPVAALALAALLLAVALAPAPAAADESPPPAQMVIEWNHALLDALTQANTPPPPAMRAGAIVATSVFDAVNGLTRRYLPYHVSAHGPRGASAQAAAAGAAHEALVALFPSQQARLDALLAATVDRLAERDGKSSAIERGLAWGASVADAVLTLRANDGFTSPLPPYVRSTAIGRWQPTPPAFPPAPAFREFATMTPWALASPAQFRPDPPPALTSARYARDFDEVKTAGSAASTTRSTFDTQTAQFWQSATPVAIWDPVADTLIARQHLGLP